MRNNIDPFGVSLLDLLSNALGAAILLFLIVSVISRGRQSENKEDSMEGGGAFFSNSNARIGEVKRDTNDYTVQIDVYGGRAKVEETPEEVKMWMPFTFDSDSSDQKPSSRLFQTYLLKQKEVMNNGLKYSSIIISESEYIGIKPDSTVVTVFNANWAVLTGSLKPYGSLIIKPDGSMKLFDKLNK